MLLYTIENEYREKGFEVIAGTDEAGRGCLAGPVVAAACILPIGLEIPGLNDSKKISPKKRELLYDIITENAVSYAIAEASVEEIDSMNILNASQLAMRRAASKLSPQPDLLLVDGNIAREFTVPTVTVIHGDAISPSIAAASILAKVYRDRLLIKMDEKYPEYGFAKHKAYSTRQHMDALRQYGPADCHRKTFLSFLEREQK